MHFSALFATSLAVAGTASAHGTPGVPKIFGRRTVAELKARGILGSNGEVSSHAARAADERSDGLEKRQVGGTDGQCGPGVGSCATGYCCSPAGWCGLGTDYCAAPDCQFNYGSGCDANTVPSGASTSTVDRTHVGSVPYGGAGIYDCTVPNMIALTYDDGPYIYTSDILDILSAENVPATFFITGNNLGKGEIDNAAYPWVSIIQRMHTDGHQIASHTWSHQDLSTEVTHAQRLNQMYYNEMALRNILGFFPTYMRPPYSSCTSGSGCESDLGTLGYHITYFDLDTQDYLNDSPTQIQTSKNIFTSSLSSSNPATDNWLVIGHDIHEQTAHNLTQFMITYAKQQGWTFGTVGQCLGDPEANWYRSSSGSVVTSTSSAPASTSTTTSSSGSSSTAVSTDGSCGGSSGFTCQGSSFGNCCSQYGWCGSTTDYCDTGCQSAFGTCGSGTATTTTSSSGSTSTLTVSTDGSCGGTSGNTCQGSTFGNCCSQYGWCGSTTAYCSNGCQTSFGTCS